jgi:hypothetical protein
MEWESIKEPLTWVVSRALTRLLKHVGRKSLQHLFWCREGCVWTGMEDQKPGRSKELELSRRQGGWAPPHGLIPWHGREACASLWFEESRSKASCKKMITRAVTRNWHQILSGREYSLGSHWRDCLWKGSCPAAEVETYFSVSRFHYLVEPNPTETE